MAFVIVLLVLCLLLLLLCGAFAEVGTLLAVFGGLFVLFVAYVGVRAAIDPEYEKRIEREAEEERKRKVEEMKKKEELIRRKRLEKNPYHYSCRHDDDGPPLAIL